jgi:hypothetical protein
VLDGPERYGIANLPRHRLRPYRGYAGGKADRVRLLACGVSGREARDFYFSDGAMSPMAFIMVALSSAWEA